MVRELYKVPLSNPNNIFKLRESSFAHDLFITSVAHFDFFNCLEKSPIDIDGLCSRLGIEKRPADVMLTLFKAYSLVREKNKLYYLTDASRDFLSRNSGFDLTSYVNSLKDRPVCEQMKKVLISGQPANWSASQTGSDWATSMKDDKFAESFTAGMNSRGAYLAHGLAKAIDLSGRRKVLDIGGGSGIYSVILLQSNPSLQATVYEKTPVDRVARYSVDKFGMGDRIEIYPGDMFKDSLPKGHDVHLLSHVLHDWDFDAAKLILKNSYNSLEPDGMVIIHDAHINSTKTGPVSVAEYSVLLMFLSEGKCYSTKEMKDTLKEIGFTRMEYRPTILNRSIIIARKPA